ncbi:MAG: sigma factor [Streptosporangiaceae bacterium]
MHDGAYPALGTAAGWRCRRFTGTARQVAPDRRVSQEHELMPVGWVGLLKAINNFDPDIGESLAAYATPCITGEIKRHFRDRRWQVQVRRSAKELRLEIRKARSDLAQQLSRLPTWRSRPPR